MQFDTPNLLSPSPPPPVTNALGLFPPEVHRSLYPSFPKIGMFTVLLVQSDGQNKLSKDESIPPPFPQRG